MEMGIWIYLSAPAVIISLRRGNNCRHRLFKNDGKGNFAIDSTAFPHNDMNISVAAENDFDQ